jgi:drug/metabolite transporter (DMT)-like permease
MSGEALALVLLGGLCHATWNLLAKRVAGGLAFVWLQGLVSAAAMAPLAAWAAWQAGLSLQSWDTRVGLAVLASAAVHVVYSLALQEGYRRGEFAVVYPVARGSGPLVSVLAAVLLLGDRPSLTGWLGVAALVAGVMLCAGLPYRASGSHARRRAGVTWGLLTGLCIAAYTVIDGWAIQQLAMLPLVFHCLGMGVRSLLLAPWALRDREALARQWRGNARTIVAVGLLAPLAYLLVLQALRSAPLSYVAPVREVSMLWAALAGAWLLKEPLSAGRVAGAVSMLLGLVLLARA